MDLRLEYRKYLFLKSMLVFKVKACIYENQYILPLGGKDPMFKKQNITRFTRKTKMKLVYHGVVFTSKKCLKFIKKTK